MSLAQEHLSSASSWSLKYNIITISVYFFISTGLAQEHLSNSVALSRASLHVQQHVKCFVFFSAYLSAVSVTVYNALLLSLTRLDIEKILRKNQNLTDSNQPSNHRRSSNTEFRGNITVC